MRVPKDHQLAKVRKGFRINLPFESRHLFKEGDWVLVTPITFRKGSELYDISAGEQGNGNSESEGHKEARSLGSIPDV